MNYPFWDVGFGYGQLMGWIAVLHVFVSHFAVGGGLYLVVMETLARRANDSARLDFVERLSRFFVLVTLVLGALTGVAIWFIIGLLNPAATQLLIHNFVWGWAIEWTFFVIEIAAAILYVYGWRRLTARDHMTVGWIYFGAAWISLVIINGILSFMLTPGRWLQTGAFVDGMLNPTYVPSLVFRTGVCLLLAGLYANLMAARLPDRAARGRLVRANAAWSLLGLMVMVPAFLWFWRSIPEATRATARVAMPIPMAALHAGLWWAAALAGLVILSGILVPRRMHPVVAVAGMVLGLGLFSQFEWTRESIRKPWAVTGVMYGNGLLAGQAAQAATTGLRPGLAFRTGHDGADLFRRACRSCHTVNGYRPLAPAFAGLDREAVAGLIQGIGKIRGNMPPFPGTAEEARLIADELWPRLDHRPPAEAAGLAGAALGRRVYAQRCGPCHVVGGFNDKTASLAGQPAADLESMLDMADDLGEEMPPFTGDPTERAALVAYLQTLTPGGAR